VTEAWILLSTVAPFYYRSVLVSVVRNGFHALMMYAFHVFSLWQEQLCSEKISKD